jgi:hypothetical protein
VQWLQHEQAGDQASLLEHAGGVALLIALLTPSYLIWVHGRVVLPWQEVARYLFGPI